MLLTVVCPACQSQYQVDPNLRGKRMRCPNTICRTVFEVADPSSPIAPPTPPPVAPLPPTETKPVEPKVIAPPVAKPIAPPKPAKIEKPVDAPTWSAPPPVRATAAAAVATPVTTSITETLDIPGDIPDDEFPEDEPAPNKSSATIPTPLKPTPPKKRRSLFPIAAVILVLVIAGLATFALQRYASQNKQLEVDVNTKALDAYKANDFKSAIKLLQDLQKEFPKSAAVPRYRLLAILSELRAELDAVNSADALAELRDHAVSFVGSYQNDPLLKDFHDDVWALLWPIAKRTQDSARESLDVARVTQAERMWALAEPYGGPAAAREKEGFQRDAAAIRNLIALVERRQEDLERLRKSKETPTLAAVVEARAIVARHKDDQEVQTAANQILAALRASIALKPAKSPDDPADDPIAMIPLVASTRPPKPARGDGPVVALSPTGVLYALHPKLGDFAWAQRLGIDSRIAPIAIRDDAGKPPKWLVVSNDKKTISLVDATSGAMMWRHVLSAPVAGEPTIALGHLLVPLTTDRLDDVDPATGKLNGFYQFDQPLPCGGTLLPGTSLVYVPGQAHGIYVIDLAAGTCPAILETGHAAGSLIGPPIVIAENEKEAWLVIVQADAGPKVRLRPLAVQTGPTPKEIVVPGTLSSPPYHDAGSILLATEEGKLYQIGVRLPGNPGDPLLFKLSPDTIAIEPSPRDRPMRAAIVHVDAENIWLSSGGRLQRLRKSFSPEKGPVVTARWPQPLWLGEPLHAAHVHTDAEGTVLFLATHDPAGTACWLSAIDGETGKILWQTQLGSSPRGDILTINDKLLWDDGAGLWTVAAPRTIESFRPFPGKSGHSVLLMRQSRTIRAAWSPGKAAITIEEIAPASMSRDIKLPAPIAGVPVLGDDALFVPLENGVLARVDLMNDSVASGPDLPPGDTPRLAVLAGDRVVVSRGKTLVVFDWGKTWKENAKVSLDRPSAGLTVVTGSEPKLLVDAVGSFKLFDAGLRPIARKDWAYKGRVTAGPFPLGDKILAVVDGKRLLALDAGRDGFLWDVSLPADIAVAPCLANNRLVVCDADGNFWLLDPTTGTNLGADNERPLLSLRANLVVAATPVPLPGGDLFVVWSDGSASVVSVSQKQ